MGEYGARRGKAKPLAKMEVKEEHMAKSKSSKVNEVIEVKEEDTNNDLIAMVESLILDARLKDLKVNDLKSYLRMHGMDDKGKKDTLIDRVLVFMEHKNSI